MRAKWPVSCFEESEMDKRANPEPRQLIGGQQRCEYRDMTGGQCRRMTWHWYDDFVRVDKRHVGRVWLCRDHRRSTRMTAGDAASSRIMEARPKVKGWRPRRKPEK